MNKGFVNVVLILLIIMAIGAGGYFLLFNKPTQDSDNQTFQTQDETSNWKTYRNKEYGFEFEYPPLFYIHDQPTGSYWELPEGNWVLVAQTSEPPKFGFEITCHFSSDFVRVVVQAKDIRTLSSSLNTQDRFIGVLEDNYITSGGAKVSDEMVNNLRIVKFDQSRVYGPEYIVFNGYAAYSISQERCGGGDVPFDKIAATFNIVRQ